MHGAINADYAALGYERGFLGHPVTDETSTPDGIGSNACLRGHVGRSGMADSAFVRDAFTSQLVPSGPIRGVESPWYVQGRCDQAASRGELLESVAEVER